MTIVEYPEEATETVFQNICSFFSRSNLLTIFQDGLSIRRTDIFFFPGGSKCSSNRHEFFRRVYRADIRRVYLFFEQTILCHRTDTNFPRNLYLDTYEFSRTLYFLIEQIFIFQEAISSPRTHYFLETPMPRTNRHFPGRYPSSNRYFINRSLWLLSNICTTDLYQYLYPTTFLSFILF